MEKYIELAKSLKMKNAKVISPKEMVFDIRTLLKCHWGCENHGSQNIRCLRRNDSFEERLEMVKSYKRILFIHSNNGRDISKACLEIERQAFLDGYHLAFAIRFCNLCKHCAVEDEKPCINPQKVRPCEAIFGIDVYETAKIHGLPCYPLQDKDDVQNRFGFVCIS